MSLVATDAEQCIIGACLLGEILDLGALRPEDFGIDAHRDAFAHVQRMWAEKRPLDVVLFDDTLPEDSAAKREGLAYWGQCAANSFPSLALSYVGRVRDAAMRRRMLALADSIAAAAHNRSGDLLEQINAAAEGVAELSGEQAPKGARRINEVLDSHLTVIGDRWDGVVHGVDTGFIDLDRFMRFRAGNVIVLAARPAMGKTSLAMQFATHLAQHGPVFVSSQEMSEGELADRLLASRGQVWLSKIIGGEMNGEDHDRFHFAVGSLRDLPLYIDDSAGQSLAAIRAKVRAIHRKQPVAGVVIDYLQLMSGKGENRNSEVEALSRGFKAMAKEFACPVILLSQLNRGVEQRPNKRPQLSDLRDSGAIEQDADIVLMLYRDDVYHQNSLDAGTAELLVRKNRQGQTGFVRLTWVGAMTTFENCDYHAAKSVEVPPRPFKHNGGFGD